MYKIIFIDIDGTLLTSAHKISKETLLTIKRITNIYKIPVILTTARPPQAVVKIYNELCLYSPVICFNGALILEKNSMDDFSILHSQTIAAKKITAIKNITSRAKVSIQYYETWQWIAAEHDFWTKQEEEITSTKAIISDEYRTGEKGATRKEGVHKILLMGHAEEINSIEHILKKEMEFLNIYKSKDTYLEITNGNASKKNAVQFLLKKFNLRDNETVAIGDNYNDIDMIQLAGMGIAMGHAPDAVKIHARFITFDNDSEGIKHALDMLLP